jgi:hypothetical protein
MDGPLCGVWCAFRWAPLGKPCAGRPGHGAGTAVLAPAKPAKLVRRLSVRPYVPPEPCSEHPGGHVTRRGVYQADGHTRQRYLCTPPGW